MANKATEQHVEQEDELEIDDEYEDGDYGFILGADGELKSMFAPDEFFLEPPPKVKRILKILGIKDINTAWDGDETIH
jgi:hypothetical protein